VRFRVLGTLQIDEGAIAPPRGLRRRLLCVLLARPNETITADRLIDELWGEEPPATARNALHVHLTHLRELLGSSDGLGAIERGDGAYRLVTEPGAVDWLAFDDHVEAGIRAASLGEASDAFEHLDTALGLWRGEPFDGTTDPTDLLGRLAARLGEARRAASVVWADVVLNGAAVDPVPMLTEAVQAFPYDEELSIRLGVALAVSGRQRDALAELRRCRLALRDDLGLTPQRQVDDCEGAILDGDEDLVDRFCPLQVGGNGSSTPLAPSAVTTGLPLSPAATPFVGRRELLRSVIDTPPPHLTWIVGPGGRGKSRFLTELAGELAEDLVRYVAVGREASGPVPFLRALLPGRDDIDALLDGLAQASTSPVEIGIAVAEQVVSRSVEAHWWLVDDSHWMRADERAAVRHLARAIGDSRLDVSLVVAGREPPPESGGLAAAWDVVDLAPLDDGSVAEILGVEVDHLPSDLLTAIHGEPLLAVQLEAATAVAGGLEQLRDPTDVVRSATDALVSSVSTDAAHVVDVLAVAGTATDRALLDRALDWSSSRLDAALDDARQAGLIVLTSAGVDLAHDTLRQPLLLRVEPVIRQRWAMVLSRASEALTAPERRTPFDAPGTDERSAVLALLHAGREALSALAFAEAARIGALGVELARPGSRDAAEARLIEALGTADEPSSGRHALLLDAWNRGRDLHDEPIMVEAAIELTGVWSPGNRTAVEAIERLRTTADEVTDAGLRSRILARVVNVTIGQVEDALLLADRCWEDALAAGDPEGLCLAAQARCYAGLGRPGASARRDLARNALDVAERAGLHERVAGLANQLFVAACALGEEVDRDRALASYRLATERTGRPTHRWRLLLLGAARAMAVGDLDLADELSSEAWRVGRAYELEDAAANRAVQRFCLTLEREELDRLRPLTPREDHRPLAVGFWLVTDAVNGNKELTDGLQLAQEFLATPRPDYLWPGTLALFDWTARFLDDTELSANVNAACKGMAGEHAVVGTGMAVMNALPSMTS
jgi:DNA-binding SARP family transcriptional activator